MVLLVNIPSTLSRLMMQIWKIILLLAAVSVAGSKSTCPAQEVAASNVVLITMDGMRLEEVFNGADKRLIIPDLGCKDVEDITKKFWVEDRIESRRYLMPFLWSMIESGGWIAGALIKTALCV